MECCDHTWGWCSNYSTYSRLYPKLHPEKGHFDDMHPITKGMTNGQVSSHYFYRFYYFITQVSLIQLCLCLFQFSYIQFPLSFHESLCRILLQNIAHKNLLPAHIFPAGVYTQQLKQNINDIKLNMLEGMQRPWVLTYSSGFRLSK